MRTATAIRDTSIQALYAMGAKLSRQQRAIVAYLAFHTHKDWTRLELAEAIPLRLSSVCGRVAELLARKVIAEGRRRQCRCSGSSAHPVKLNPQQAVLEL